jgi:hypothetical protein
MIRIVFALALFLCFPTAAYPYFISYDFPVNAEDHYDVTQFHVDTDGLIDKSTWGNYHDWGPVGWRVLPSGSDPLSGQVNVLISRHFSYSVSITSQENLSGTIHYTYDAPSIQIPPDQILVANVGETYFAYWAPSTYCIYPDVTSELVVINRNLTGEVEFYADQVWWTDLKILVPEPSTIWFLLMEFICVLFCRHFFRA